MSKKGVAKKEEILAPAVKSGKKSKTNVSARREQKAKESICKHCGKKVEVILSVSPTGKKSFRRLCCEN